MQRAQRNRKVGETKMNEHSSRSHCIFTLQISSKVTMAEGDGMMEINGKLHMVDLAGSECAKTAGLDGKSSSSESARERERKNINTSLLTLGRVISMLKERSDSERPNKRIRIPYRDSKLTRILQESLGGRCKTVIIGTLSPSASAIEESISTLNYAQAANGIVNKPVATSYLSSMSLSAKGGSSANSSGNGENAKDERGSVEFWNEMECRLLYMQAQVEEAQGALGRKHILFQEATEKGDQLQAEKNALQQKLVDAVDQVDSLNKNLVTETKKCISAETKCEEAVVQIQSLQGKLAEEKEAKIAAEENYKKATEDIFSLQKQLWQESEAKIAVENKYKEMTNKANMFQQLFEEERRVKQEVEVDLKRTDIKLQKTFAILQATQITENKLTLEASKLLQTLKESIKDGDFLYSVIMEQRDADIKRRLMTKKFHAASVAVLEKTNVSLSDLCSMMVNHKSLVVKMAENSFQKREVAIKDTIHLFKAAVENVAKLTAAMKSQMTDNAGILPAMTIMASSVEDGVEQVVRIITEGEETLQKSNQLAQCNLKKYTKHLDELKNLHETSYNQTMIDVKASITKSKIKINDMVASMAKVLAQTKSQRVKMRSEHLSLLSDWKDKSLDTTNQIHKLSSDQEHRVQESLLMVEKNIEYLDKIDEELVEQKSYIHENNSAYNQIMCEQNSCIQSQFEMYKSSYEHQQRIREDFVQSIMTGVQELISKKIDILAVEQSNQYATMKLNSDSLVGFNGLLASSAQNIMNAVEKTNTSMRQQSVAVRDSDSQIKLAMEKTKNVLTCIAKDSNKQIDLISKLSEHVVTSIAEMEKHESSTNHIIKNVSDMGRKCNEVLSGTVLKKANAGISSLYEVGRSIDAYSSDVIVSNSLNSLKEIVKPRKNTLNNCNNKLQELSKVVLMGKETIQQVAENQCAVAEKILSEVESKEIYYKNYLAPCLEQSNLADKRDILHSSSELSKTTTTKLSETSTETSTVANNFSEYLNAVNAEDFQNIPSRIVLTYKEQMSATPSDDEIIKSMTLESPSREVEGHELQINEGLIYCISTDSCGE
mmetsp:Transcript_7675/g.16643  ORF Transcript_7675/g.16643 Transcript_7675/m.16643 type:complete len:1058 (-) Transcript_7675:124-3297(-)